MKQYKVTHWFLKKGLHKEMLVHVKEDFACLPLLIRRRVKAPSHYNELHNFPEERNRPVPNIYTITNWRNKSLNTHNFPDECILGGTIDRFANIFKFYVLLANRLNNQKACPMFADMATAN